MEEQPPVFEKAGSTRTLNVFFNKLINLTCLYFGKNLKVSDKKNKKTLEFTNPRENKNTIFKKSKNKPSRLTKTESLNERCVKYNTCKKRLFFNLEKALFISVNFKATKFIPRPFKLFTTKLRKEELYSAKGLEKPNRLLKRPIFTVLLNKTTASTPLEPTKLKVMSTGTISFLLKKYLKAFTKLKDSKNCILDRLNKFKFLKKGRIDCKLPFWPINN